MSLVCFKWCRRNRKGAVKVPTPPLQTHSANGIQGSDIDDAVTVPTKGFLDGSLELPTYQPRSNYYTAVSPANYVVLTISDVLRTMSRESYLARCVLFETARLQRRVFSVGPLKLSLEARAVDMELIKLYKVLDEGHELIHDPWREEDREKQGSILEGEPFQKALGAAKKSLLELEKIFNDQILGELKNGMQSNESVDHGQLVGKVGNMQNELRQVYERVENTYLEEARKMTQVARATGDGVSRS
ncbi:hypothetical protein B0I37DRAFT_448644 [Chaetomium sp. MPI-CAGE-AT-0009]|nr:hypothetical protein B0I37DRAFT_448644 [Chaetomium sp. MPI-CAGE-AT-0009]